MTFNRTYFAYTAAADLIEDIAPLAQAGDTDALVVVGELMLVTTTLSGQLRRKIAVARSEMEGERHPWQTYKHSQ